MEQQQELIAEIKKLRELIEKLNRHYSNTNLFLGGMLRGMGILVGATLLVLVGSTILGLLGLLPGLSDIVTIIVDAFDKARLQ
jgi:hypothetical protein